MSSGWLTLFNVDKCKIMHFWVNNSKRTCVMNRKDWMEIIEERDFSSDGAAGFKME
jgi:hypothetical protein